MSEPRSIFKPIRDALFFEKNTPKADSDLWGEMYIVISYGFHHKVRLAFRLLLLYLSKVLVEQSDRLNTTVEVVQSVALVW